MFLHHFLHFRFFFLPLNFYVGGKKLKTVFFIGTVRLGRGVVAAVAETARFYPLVAVAAAADAAFAFPNYQRRKSGFNQPVK